MEWGSLAALITIVSALIGLGTVLAKLVTVLTKLSEGLAALKEFKKDAEEEHEAIEGRVADHEERIHTLEDWKKFKEGKL